MIPEWSLSEDKLALRPPRGADIPIASKIREILSFENLALVLLDYRTVPPLEAGRNVYAFSEEGILLWQIAAIPADDVSPYVEIRKKSDTLATLHNWSSFLGLWM